MDLSDVAMEPHHVIAGRISIQEQHIDGLSGAEYVPEDDSNYAGAGGLPLPNGGE